MKISKSRLKQIIKEELSSVLSEEEDERALQKRAESDGWKDYKDDQDRGDHWETFEGGKYLQYWQLGFDNAQEDEQMGSPLVDKDDDGIPDEKELAVVDKGELSGSSLDEVLTQLFDLRKQHKAKQQWEVAGFIDEAIERLERAISSSKALSEGARGYYSGNEDTDLIIKAAQSADKTGRYPITNLESFIQAVDMAHADDAFGRMKPNNDEIHDAWMEFVRRDLHR